MNTILASFDIVNLYTNIDHDFGLIAIHYWLSKYTELIHSRFNTNFIVDSITFILKNNYFMFNEEYFLQIKGTAMGTKFAPMYANLVIGYFETILHQKLSISFDSFFISYFGHTQLIN